MGMMNATNRYQCAVHLLYQVYQLVYLMASRTRTNTRPTTRSSASLGRRRTRGQMSSVKIVEAELNTEVKEDISAACSKKNQITRARTNVWDKCSLKGAYLPT